jgi:hypothetical protein
MKKLWATMVGIGCFGDGFTVFTGRLFAVGLSGLSDFEF